MDYYRGCQQKTFTTLGSVSPRRVARLCSSLNMFQMGLSHCPKLFFSARSRPCSENGDSDKKSAFWQLVFLLDEAPTLLGSDNILRSRNRMSEFERCSKLIYHFENADRCSCISEEPELRRVFEHQNSSNRVRNKLQRTNELVGSSSYPLSTQFPQQKY